ncbi:MAG: DUF211 domain-containing protein [Nanobdellota archaeon]
MSVIRYLVLDVLKPYNPSVTEMAKEISDLEGVKGTNITVMEVDRDVESIKITIKGDDINLTKLREVIEKNSATIHSIDKVACGDEFVEEAKIPQD